MLAQILEEVRELKGKFDQFCAQAVQKEFYSTSEIAEILGRAEYTVREWCRQGRIRAKKKPCGRGKGGEWLVSHDELARLRNEGLLPLRKPE